MATALVTGATAGIGAAFARHLAARGDNLVLVARDVERLEAAKAMLESQHGVQVEVMSADLAVREDVARVAARLEDPERPVDVLVNNAGFSLHVPLTDPDISAHDRAFEVMVRAVLVLGGAAGRAMRERGQGLIINTGSTQGWITTGNYSAIKAWVNNYSQSLYNELRPSGVHVMLLAPGWVRTEFHARGGDKSSLPGWVWVDVDELVGKAMKDAATGKVISIPTIRYTIAIAIADHLLPRSTIRLFSRLLNHSRRKK